MGDQPQENAILQTTDSKTEQSAPERNTIKEANADRGTLVEQQQEEMAYQKREDRPPGDASRALGRPEIVDEEGKVLVKGKNQSGDASDKAPESTSAASGQDGKNSLKNGKEFSDQFFKAEPGKESLFDRVNKDGDDKISMTELQLALINSDYKGKDAQALAALYRSQVVASELLDKSNEGWMPFIGRKVAEAHSEIFNDYPLKHTDDYDNLTFSKDDIKATANSKAIDFTLKETSFHSDGKLWGKGTPQDSIKPEAITQGAVGDCHLLSTLGSLANTPEGRQAISNMIEPAGQNGKGDQLYRVTFADPSRPEGKAVYTVSSPTDSELALYAKDTGHGVWPNVMEKAYAEHRKSQAEFQEAAYFDKTGRRYRPMTYPVHEANTSGKAEGNMPLFTGKSAEIFDITEMKDSPLKAEEQVRGALEKMFKDGERPCVTAMVPKEPKNAHGYSQDAGLVTGHEYMVLGYDAKSGELTIRNPHGENVSSEKRFESKDGTFKMPVDRFVKNFGPVRFTKDVSKE